MKLKIGIFDSGIGGFTILDPLLKKRKDLEVFYLADTKRVPYGNKSKDRIRQYSKEIVKWLTEQDCKMIVIACNTASALALDFLRSKFDIPIIGVIEPGSLLAAKTSKNNRIGGLGT